MVRESSEYGVYLFFISIDLITFFSTVKKTINQPEFLREIKTFCSAHPHDAQKLLHDVNKSSHELDIALQKLKNYKKNKNG